MVWASLIKLINESSAAPDIASVYFSAIVGRLQFSGMVENSLYNLVYCDFSFTEVITSICFHADHNPLHYNSLILQLFLTNLVINKIFEETK